MNPIVKTFLSRAVPYFAGAMLLIGIFPTYAAIQGGDWGSFFSALPDAFLAAVFVSALATAVVHYGAEEDRATA